MLTQQRVKDLLIYCQLTGKLIWRSTCRNRHKGRVAGSVDSKGYGQIKVDGRIYMAHRLVWLYHYGYIPENQIDHINRRPLDNRIENLRDVSQSCNLRNTPNRKNNTSGVKGVDWNKQHCKWTVRIHTIESRKFVGRYKDFDEAVCARFAAEQCLDWAGCDSESPAFKYVRDKIQGR